MIEKASVSGKLKVFALFAKRGNFWVFYAKFVQKVTGKGMGGGRAENSSGGVICATQAGARQKAKAVM